MTSKNTLYLRLIFFIFAASVAEQKVLAYPSMVRHGYTTCITCHFNASGGGNLRAYGKYVAGEVMGYKNDSGSAWQWMKKPEEDERFLIGFFGRTAQTYFENEQVRRADFRKMQADIEVSFDYKEYVATATFGPRLDSANQDSQYSSDMFVRRFYVGKQQKNYSVKAGLFFPEYGLNMPNHNLPTRKGLFFNHNQEPWTAQASYFTPTFDYTVAYLEGAFQTQAEDMFGYSGTIAYKTGAARYGVSAIQFTHPDSDRTNSSLSAFATVGYQNVGYTLVEIASKSVVNALGVSTDSMLGFIESGWEIRKGVVPYFIYEFTKNVTSDTLNHAPGVGIQFGPVTHIEIMAQASRTLSPVGDGYALFSMFNFYF